MGWHFLWTLMGGRRLLKALIKFEIFLRIAGQMARPLGWIFLWTLMGGRGVLNKKKFFISFQHFFLRATPRRALQLVLYKTLEQQWKACYCPIFKTKKIIHIFFFTFLAIPYALRGIDNIYLLFILFLFLHNIKFLRFIWK